MLRSTAWNLAGNGLPLLAGLWAMPVVAAAVGAEGLGLLALGWAVVGYFGLFDFGLGRVLTQRIAQDCAVGASRQHVQMLVTRLGLWMWALGLLGALLLAALAPWLAASWQWSSPALAAQVPWVLTLLAACVPWVVASATWRGVLEGVHAFAPLNWVRIPLGVGLFVVPALVVQFTQSVWAMMAGLLLTRMVGWWALRLAGMAELRRLPASQATPSLPLPRLGEMLRLGGWMTVSNLVGPFMVYADRFVIAALMSTAAVAVYVAPYEVATRLLVVGAALTAVLFPVLSASWFRQPARAVRLYNAAAALVVWVTGTAVLWLSALAGWGLERWLGPEFASPGERVAHWLLLGVWLNALGQVAMTTVQAAGRPDLSAKLHLIELPIYAVALAWAAYSQSLVVVAMAWALRAGLDALALVVLARRLQPAGLARWPRESLLLVGLALTWLPAWSLLGASVYAGLAAALSFSAVALVRLPHLLRTVREPVPSA